MRVLLNHWKNSPERSIPSSGATEIGNITHRLYDRASNLNYQSESSTNEWKMKDARAQFQELVREEEEKLRKCPVNEFLLPLEDIKNFSNKRAKACQEAIEYRKKAIERDSRISRNRESIRSIPRLTGSEVEVWDSRRKIEGYCPDVGDFSVKGSIDYVSVSNDGYEILDYKTGKIVDEDGKVKREYEVQILLYSAMLRMTSIQAGIPLQVVKGVLKHAFSREKREIELGRDREDALLDSAVSGLEDINRVVGGAETTDEITERLASPGLEACRFCDYRAGCAPFQESLRQWMIDNTDDVSDVIGIVKSAPTNSRPGSNEFQFMLEDSQKNTWLIEGVNSERYPSVEGARIGDKAAVFGGKTREYPVSGIHRKFKASMRSHAFFVESK